jgi:hypothetical protein
LTKANVSFITSKRGVQRTMRPSRACPTNPAVTRPRGYAEARLDFAYGEARWPCSDKQADDFEAGRVAQLGQSPGGGI